MTAPSSNAIRTMFNPTVFIGLILSGAMFLFQLYGCVTCMQADKWPSTTGVVTSARYVRSHSGNRSLRVKYRYEVDGKSHTSGQVNYGHLFAPTLRNTGYRNDTYDPTANHGYAQGDYVNVYYDPEHPEHSLLETDFPPAGYVIIAVSMAVFIFFLAALKNKRLGLWLENLAFRGEKGSGSARSILGVTKRRNWFFRRPWYLR